MFQLDLGFEIQGIAKFDAISKKLIIGDCEPFKEVQFNGYGAYIRETGFETPVKEKQMGCDEWNYRVTKEYAFIYFDFIGKYTIESVRNTVFSQLNQKDINVKSIKMDFQTIKTEEKLTKLKDACLLKITFDSTEDFINDCEGLICPC